MLINCTKQIAIANKCLLADTFLKRLKGLLGTNSLPEGNVLIIKPCFSVHTCGMKYSIDVLFIDEYDNIIKIAANLQPGKVVCCRKSYYVVEMPAGTVEKYKIDIGDKIKTVW